MRCLPFPLSMLCRLDNRSARHAASCDNEGLLCRAHDLALAVWLKVPGPLVRWSAGRQG